MIVPRPVIRYLLLDLIFCPFPTGVLGGARGGIRPVRPKQALTVGGGRLMSSPLGSGVKSGIRPIEAMLGAGAQTQSSAATSSNLIQVRLLNFNLRTYFSLALFINLCYLQQKTILAKKDSSISHDGSSLVKKEAASLLVTPGSKFKQDAMRGAMRGRGRGRGGVCVPLL